MEKINHLIAALRSHFSADDINPEHIIQRRRVMTARIMSAVTQLSIVLAVAFFLYVSCLKLLDNRHPTVYTNSPFPVETSVVRQGEEVVFYTEYCVKDKVDTTLQSIWVQDDGGGYFIGKTSIISEEDAPDIGCYSELESQAVPPILSRGIYHLEIVITQRTNWAHDDVQRFNTQTFNYME